MTIAFSQPLKTYMWRSLKGAAGKARPLSNEAVSELMWALLLRLMPLHNSFGMRCAPASEQNWALLPTIIKYDHHVRTPGKTMEWMYVCIMVAVCFVEFLSCVLLTQRPLQQQMRAIGHGGLRETE